MTLRVYLCDLIHNYSEGSNVLSGEQDFTIPLNVACIGAYAKQVYGDELDLRIFKYPDRFLQALDAERPHVVGLSSYAWNTRLNFEVALYIKKHYPDILVVMGGPSIRTDEEGIGDFLRLNRQIDAYILYEGERAFVDLLQHVVDFGTDLRTDELAVPNVYRLRGDELLYVQETKFPDLDDLPSPYLTGMMDEFLSERLIPLFETNRGCPFACTFCTWGIASLNQVRKFPMERVLAEMDYVADRFPDYSVWIIADANFGIHPRDLDTARKIQEIKERTPALETILTWDSKNTKDRNKEIALILRSTGTKWSSSPVNRAYLAVQHLSPHVLENIKRSNMKFDFPNSVKWFHDKGVEVNTDVLYGLPGETYEDAVDSLALCFDAGFDFINLNRTLMLAGSELETDDSRRSHGFRTKFLVRRGSFGDYRTTHENIRAVECDEVINASSTLDEKEIISLHCLQWLIFIGWNHQRWKPLLRALQQQCGINPMTVLRQILDGAGASHPKIEKHFSDFKDDLAMVLFDSPEAMHKHFSRDTNWDWLCSHIKTELKYNALMYYDRTLHEAFCDLLGDITKRHSTDPVFAEILHVIRADFIDIDDVSKGIVPPPETFHLSNAATNWLMLDDSDVDDPEGQCLLTIEKKSDEIEAAQRILCKADFSANPIVAIERLIGPNLKFIRFERRVQRIEEVSVV